MESLSPYLMFIITISWIFENSDLHRTKENTLLTEFFMFFNSVQLRKMFIYCIFISITKDLEVNHIRSQTLNNFLKWRFFEMKKNKNDKLTEQF